MANRPQQLYEMVWENPRTKAHRAWNSAAMQADGVSTLLRSALTTIYTAPRGLVLVVETPTESIAVVVHPRDRSVLLAVNEDKTVSTRGSVDEIHRELVGGLGRIELIELRSTVADRDRIKLYELPTRRRLMFGGGEKRHRE